MPSKEAKARIKINRLLDQAGWRFFDDANGRANIQLETHTRITQAQLNAFGENFETTKNGFIDFLLLDPSGFPLIVLEAKSEEKNPLVGKEQARTYAKSQNCRFIILSNGNLHYFWDLRHGSPYVITQFPDPASVVGYKRYQPNPAALVSEYVDEDYIVLTQLPKYRDEAGWKNADEREHFIETNRLRFLRPYQLNAIQKLQDAVSKGRDRFLFEMATGTGKTLTAAAVIKLFLRTKNAHRVLFLVDRLELEDQAKKQFTLLLKNDFKTVIYKENRDDWTKAEIVVTTVQSLLSDNKYKKLFSPTDFDLIISDEAHRSIGGNARAVFEYFVGYKLGLTATPRDYLIKFDHARPTTRDPREYERRVLLDTYRTFGCDDGTPTFRYSLLDGVREGYLINPTVVDARTDVTTQLLSDEGYAVLVPTEDGIDAEQFFDQRDFEKKFFSEATNRLFCKTFLEHALRDPISGEIGKTIIFAVSQAHAAKLTQILNEMADKIYPNQYNSDFAIQVTSAVADAQQFAINFTNNNLSGSANFLPAYKTSKTRVCVTVGMMTTGYDCTDLLNLCLMRPIFSPTDFIQMKGRGTRTHNFTEQVTAPALVAQLGKVAKTNYKLFDFFATCEYFEKEFKYDQVLALPPLPAGESVERGAGETVVLANYENFDPDALRKLNEIKIGSEGMKIDRMFFDRFQDRVKQDPFIKTRIEQGQWDAILDYVNTHVLNKPEEFYTLEKLRRAAGIDRRLSLREIIEKAFGLIPAFKSKQELLQDEFDKFVADRKPDSPESILALKYFFQAYISDGRVRDMIDRKKFNELQTNPTFTMQDYKAVPERWRTEIPEYIKDYVTLNQFLPS
ncbi:MAG: DEAD/DEAH box helicase family protein [Anaerolineae bacterium]|nr:DEAD/DEAH box helicase family protein [Anaerolineae bacterium]